MNGAAELTEKAIADLKPYENNARTHSPQQVETLRRSLREYGFVNPVLIDREGNVIAGHGRLLAAKAEGLDKVPCVYVDDLTEAQKRAYILADNRLALDAGWNEKLLREELEDLIARDFDPALTGFSERELEDLLAEEPTDDNFDVEAELKRPAFSRAGDIWQLGKHRVTCGDSTEKESYERLLGGRKADLVLTDAPYFVDLRSKSGKITNDNLGDDEAYEFLLKVFQNFYDHTAVTAAFYEFYATIKSRIFYDAFEDAGFTVERQLTWKKPSAPFMRTDWKFNMEPIIYGTKGGGLGTWHGTKAARTVFEFDGIRDSETEGYGHPSSKPVPLLSHLILQSSRPGEIVLDGFLGSASTLVACEETGRICYGIELEPKFVDVAVNRYIELKHGEDGDVTCWRHGKQLSCGEAKNDKG